MAILKIVLISEAFIVALAMLTGAVYAKETIDLQNYVDCGYDTCSLSVDINELPLSADGKTFLKNAKKDDLVSAVSELPTSIREFDYYIQDKEKLIVTADIQPASSNYWYMEFADFILDPWFNSSWLYRQNITLYSPYDNTTYNDVLINLTMNTFGLIAEGKMQEDCDDLLITNSNDTELNYTLEGCGLNDTTIWLWVDSLNHYNTTLVYAYYGNNETDSHDWDYKMCDIGIETWFMFDQIQTADATGTGDKCNNYNLDSDFGDTAVIDGFAHNDTEYDSNDCLTTTEDYSSLGTFSVELIVKPAAETALSAPIIKGNLDVGAGEREWVVLHSNSVACSGKLSFGMLNDMCAEDSEVYTCSDDIGTGSWAHFVGVRASNYIVTYTNARDGAPETCYNNGYTDGDLVLGSHDCSGTINYGWQGESDNYRVWNRALSKGEITIMYEYLFNPDMSSPWSDEDFYGEPEPEPEPNITAYDWSYVICVDNETLMRNETLIINGFRNNTLKYDWCQYGCDNNTMNCNYPPYIEGVLDVSIIAIIILIFAYVSKKVIK